MNSDRQKSEQELSISLSEDVARGIYSNLALISHSSNELVIDYLSLLPGMNNKASVVSRIIMTPEHAKRLLAALHDNIMKYESTYGKIEIKEEVRDLSRPSQYRGDA